MTQDPTSLRYALRMDSITNTAQTVTAPLGTRVRMKDGTIIKPLSFYSN